MNSNPLTFLQIRAARGIELEAIARLAGMKPEDVYYLEAGCPYDQASIERVLLALSTLAGEHYTLETVGGIYVQA